MAGESGATARSGAPAPGRACELRLPAPRAPLAAGERIGLPAKVRPRAAAPACLRRTRAGDAAGGGLLLRVRRRLGSCDPAVLRGARGRATGARGHPPERTRRARE